ncbi:hypothetical protein [Burkholderia gladioli]|uniref:hypothetical protein n=1 Tax=Burkholderia gladioli TaxID=28095 RepID=UPI0016410A57|nr:hypothetical protein [Burkholderia gladioli]
MIETARWSDNRLRNRPINPKEKARITFAMRAFEFGGESGIRTPDLRIMIPSYCPAINSFARKNNGLRCLALHWLRIAQLCR